MDLHVAVPVAVGPGLPRHRLRHRGRLQQLFIQLVRRDAAYHRVRRELRASAGLDAASAVVFGQHPRHIRVDSHFAAIALYEPLKGLRQLAAAALDHRTARRLQGEGDDPRQLARAWRVRA